MGSYKEIFHDKRTVLPVVHVQNTEHALRNTSIARNAGADGVFLISMGAMSHHELNRTQKIVKNKFGNWFVGVNYLDLPATRVFNAATEGVDGVWNDNAFINEDQEAQYEAELINTQRLKSDWRGLYFGGVAFKYQKPVDDVSLAAKIATRYMDVVTTSGDGTGFAPHPEKIQMMKESIGDHPLAIASGISPENIHKYLDFADCFMVASSLLLPGTEELDPSRVRALVEAVKSSLI